MRKVQLALYVIVIILAFCEEEQIPVIPAFWYYWSKFWYGLAEFAGRTGINAEHNYNESMKVASNG